MGQPRPAVRSRLLRAAGLGSAIRWCLVNQQWPEDPLIPEAWADEVKYHPIVVAALAEGFCPKHLVKLTPAGSISASAADFCPPCRASWEFTTAAGTASTSDLLIPRFAVTDGSVVLVSRTL